MPSLHQDLVYNHCQCESIVVHISFFYFKVRSLKLGRRVVRFAHEAVIHIGWRDTVVANLERVSVYQGNVLVIRDVGIGLVDVPYHVTAPVELSECSGKAPCGRTEIPVVNLRGVKAPDARIIVVK